MANNKETKSRETGEWVGSSAPPDAEDVPPPVPEAKRYERIGALGSGGMGEVVKVHDQRLNRVLAMKILHADYLGTAVESRFVAEAQATAQLEHPGIVPVFDQGNLPDGRPFYTMQIIRGRTLGDAIDAVHAHSTPSSWGAASEGWTFLRLMDMFRQVCETVGYAHSRGVIHRDLKPDNIMIGDHGEVRVVDWGLVKVVDGAPPDGDQPRPAPQGPVVTNRSRHSVNATRDGSVAGTPAYMPPEQAAGYVADLDAASDIFALGGTMLYLLVGKTPLEALDPMPALVDAKRVPEALGKICIRAMQLRQGDRFADGAEMAAAVSGWLEEAFAKERDRELADGADAAFEQVRDRSAAMEAMLRLVGPSGAPVPRPMRFLDPGVVDHLTAVGLVRSEDIVGLADEQLARSWPRLADRIETDAFGHALRHRLLDAAGAWDEAGRPGHLLWLGEAAREADAWHRQGNALAGAIDLHFIRAGIDETDRRTRLRRRSTGMFMLALTAVTAVALAQWRTAVQQRQVAEVARVEADTRRLIAQAQASEAQRFPHEALANYRAAASMTGEAAALAEQEVDRLAATLPVVGVRPLKPGRPIALAKTAPMAVYSIGKETFVGDLRTGSEHHQNLGAVDGANISGDGTVVVTWIVGESPALWSGADFSESRTLSAVTAKLGGPPTLNLDGRYLFASAGDRRVVDLETDAVVARIDNKRLRRVFANSAGGFTLESTDGPFRWVPGDEAFELFADLAGYVLEQSDPDRALRLDADGLAVHDLATGAHRVLDVLPGVNHIEMSGDWLVASNGESLEIWSLPKGRRAHELNRFEANISALRFRDDQRVLAVGAGRDIALIDVLTGERLATRRGHRGVVGAMGYWADGTLASLSSADQSLRVWSPPRPDSVASAACGMRPVHIASSPDGIAHAVAESANGPVCLVDLEAGTENRLELTPPLEWSLVHDRTFTAAEADGEVVVSATTGEILYRTAPVQTGEARLAISPELELRKGPQDGLSAVSSTGELLWSAPSRGEVVWTRRHGRYAAIAYVHRQVQIIDLRAPDKELVLEDIYAPTRLVMHHWALGFALNEHAGLIAAARPEGVDLFDLDTGAHRLLPMDVTPARVVFSPDGKRIAGVDEHGQISIHEVDDGALFGSLRIADPPPQNVALSHSGDRVVATVDEAVEVWDVTLGRPLAVFPPPLIHRSVSDARSLVAAGPGGLHRQALPDDPPGEAAGMHSNFRVCAEDYRVVAVDGPPPGEVWAPRELCEDAILSSGDS